MEKPPSNLIALYYLNLKEGERPLCYPTLTTYFTKFRTKIEESFQLKKFIVVADAGLNGWENKVYNNMKNNNAYIVTQPIKKMKKTLRNWAIDPSGWRVSGHKEKLNLQEIMNTAENEGDDIKNYKIKLSGVEYKVYDLVFCKERWEKTTKNSEVAKKKYTLEERYIVSFSFRQKAYHKYIRDHWCCII